MKEVPHDLAELIDGYSWERITIGRLNAMTFWLKGPIYNQYLKIQPNHFIENLYDEKERLEWLQGRLSVPKVLYYNKDEANEYLLTTEITGINASDKAYETNLPLLIELLVVGLKKIHSLSIEGCPFIKNLDVKIEEARKRLKMGLLMKVILIA